MNVLAPIQYPSWPCGCRYVAGEQHRCRKMETEPSRAVGLHGAPTQQASGPALHNAADEGSEPETPTGVPRSGPSLGITGHQGAPSRDGSASLPTSGSARHARAAATCDVLAEQIRAVVTTMTVVREWGFDPEREWRFDIAVPLVKLAVEVDGGAFTGGHKRGAAYADECERNNAAVLLGWRVLRFTNKQARTTAVDTIRAALAPKENA